MRLKQTIPKQAHSNLSVGAHDHHSAPTSVTINNTTQSLPPGTSYNLDVTLPRSDYKIARVMIMGPDNVPTGVTGAFREFCEVVATTDSGEAMGHSVRNAGSFKKVYAATYSKQIGDSYLSHKIFDNVTAQRYIQLLDAQIIGAVLRLTFRNTFGGSVFLWVKGQALLW